VKLLLDTHTFIYFTTDPDALPARARTALADPSNDLLLSLASPWEMQIKINLGKLTLARPVGDLVQFELDRGSLSLLPITLAHIDALSRLPSHHRDPFDRILVAQSIHEGITIVTADRQLRLYPVSSLWD